MTSTAPMQDRPLRFAFGGLEDDRNSFPHTQRCCCIAQICRSACKDMGGAHPLEGAIPAGRMIEMNARPNSMACRSRRSLTFCEQGNARGTTPRHGFLERLWERISGASRGSI